MSLCACRNSSVALCHSVSPRLRRSYSANSRRSYRALSRPNQYVTALKASADGTPPLGGWLDLTALVANSSAGSTTGFASLLEKVGDDIYLDFNGWHLYLRDCKFQEPLVSVLAEKVKSGDIRDVSDVEGLLKGVPLNLGSGKIKVSVYDAMPSRGAEDLYELLQQYADDRL